MKIDNVEFNASIEDILEELIKEMRINNIPYMQRVRPTPTGLQVCCPFHKGGMEKKPSAGIRATDGILHCFSCNTTKTLPEVISHCFGYDDIGTFGWKWLFKNFATLEVEERKDVKLDFKRNTDSIRVRHPVIGDSSRDSVNSVHNISNKEFVTEKELDSYRYYHPYWKKRGIVDDYVIEMFDLGYDATNQSITFPVKDSSGNCVFVARRSVNTKWFNYPKGSEKPLYGLWELKQLPTFPNEIYITESMIDCLLLWQCKKYAVALNGLGTVEQYKQICSMPCRKVILATDNDDAGKSARIKLREQIGGKKLVTEVLIPNGKKDIGECTPEEIQNLQEIF